MSSPVSYQDWYANFLQIPWLNAGPVGQQEAKTWPALLDSYVSLLYQARKACFPDYAPTDALPHIGGDRGLIQGASETNQSFITRLKSVWNDWAIAGTHAELLSQIAYQGWTAYNNVVAVQANGLYYTLNSAPTPGVAPNGIVTVGTLGTNATLLTPAPLTGSPGYSGIGYTKRIPASSNWWVFDSRTDFCSRFAIIFTANISFNAQQLSVLQSIVKTWRRASQTCVGVYILSAGKMLGWPVRNLGVGNTLGGATVTALSGPWQ